MNTLSTGDTDPVTVPVPVDKEAAAAPLTGSMEEPCLDDTEPPPTALELAQQQESYLLLTLAKQLEYYFSQHNLATDTYLQTLRDLNDGCVPVTILSNFAKVRSILAAATAEYMSRQSSSSNSSASSSSSSRIVQEEEYRMHSILQAVNEYYTDLLHVYSIDTATGKITTDDTPSSAITILAVGMRDRDCTTGIDNAMLCRGRSESFTSRIVLDKNQLDGQQTQDDLVRSSSSGSLPVVDSNVIILRDVDPRVTEQEVRTLFDEVDDCPPVLSVISDVANSWFIALDISDRTELMCVMMRLRSMTFPSTGDYVMARLRASIVTQAPVDVYTGSLPPSLLDPNNSGVLPKKKKKKKRCKSKKNKSSKFGTPSLTSTPLLPPPPPALTEDHFPSLLEDNKVEWETIPVEVDDSLNDDDDDDDDDDEDDTSEESVKNGEGGGDEEEGPRKSSSAKLAAHHSDVASTATTTSSNASSTSTNPLSTKTSQQPVLGGYAAALLKPPPTTTMTKPTAGAVPAPSSSSTASSVLKPPEYQQHHLSETTPVSPISTMLKPSAAVVSSTTASSHHHDDTAVKPNPAIVVAPPSAWAGGRRSFAEIVRQQSHE